MIVVGSLAALSTGCGEREDTTTTSVAVTTGTEAPHDQGDPSGDDRHRGGDTTAGTGHGTSSPGDAAASVPDGSRSIDPGPLHDLDSELAAGIGDPAAQRELVDSYITMLEEWSPPPGSKEAELLDVLRQLSEALASADAEAAASLAARAHELAHELEG